MHGCRWWLAVQRGHLVPHTSGITVAPNSDFIAPNSAASLQQYISAAEFLPPVSAPSDQHVQRRRAAFTRRLGRRIDAHMSLLSLVPSPTNWRAKSVTWMKSHVSAAALDQEPSFSSALRS